MANHTPGPWLVDKDGNVYAEAHYVPAPFTDTDGVYHPDHMDGLVALVYPCLDAGSATDVRDNAAANARLMAGAPEMHEALRQIAFDPMGPADASAEYVLNAVMAIARAAIAKAEVH